MTPGEHATHTVVKFPALNSGQHESKQESKPDAVAPWDTPLGANNLLRKIVLRPAEWEGVRVPPRRWFAQNRIPMREVTGLGGDGGIGKTQLAQQAAVRCATDARDWLGAPLLEVGPSVFFTAEEPANEVHFRLDCIREHHNLTWADLANVHPICTAARPIPAQTVPH